MAAVKVHPDKQIHVGSEKNPPKSKIVEAVKKCWEFFNPNKVYPNEIPQISQRNIEKVDII